ncbi:ribosomal protein S18-alanine N-acetyltransferase [bacterium]
MINIQKMTEQDIDCVVNIENMLFGKPWSRNIFEKELTLPFSYFYSAHESSGKDKMIVGYTGFWQIYNEAQLLTIAVHPKWQNKGIASGLMKFIVKEALYMDIQKVTLEVRASNKKAVGFYLKHNFKKKGIRKNYYTDPLEHALLMEKELSR